MQGAWNEDEYLALDTNLLVEFTNGNVEVLPVPTDRHQAMVGFLYVLLAAFAQRVGGIVRMAPLRVRVGPKKYREPDLVFVSAEDDPRRQNPYWIGADLVIEVVSRDGEERDWVQKRIDYAQAGIGEYWIVDPQQEVIVVLRLTADHYAEHGVFVRGQTVTSARWFDLTTMVDHVLDAK